MTRDQAPVEIPVTRSEPIELRIRRVERLLVAAYVIVVAVLLIAGFFTPAFISRPGTDEESQGSLAAAVGGFFSGAPSSGEAGLVFLLSSGFLGLAAITWLIVLVVLPAALQGALRGRLLTFARIPVGLGLVGSVVPLLFGLMAIGAEDSEFGWGGPILIVGMLASLLLVLPAAGPLVGAEERSAT
jgi:hypothetical protein